MPAKATIRRSVHIRGMDRSEETGAVQYELAPHSGVAQPVLHHPLQLQRPATVSEELHQ